MALLPDSISLELLNDQPNYCMKYKFLIGDILIKYGYWCRILAEPAKCNDEEGARGRLLQSSARCKTVIRVHGSNWVGLG